MKIKMKTYRMTLKRMMMTVLMMLITVSAMSAEQKIWLNITGKGTVEVSANKSPLTFTDGMATVTVIEGQIMTVTVTVTPEQYYVVTSVTAQRTTSADNADTRTDVDASFIDVKKASDTEYTFEMPKDYNVRINVTFESTRKDPENVSDTSPVGIDFSGRYFISNNSDQTYYLCPATVYYDDTGYEESGDMPYLTTYKTNQDANSRWQVKFAKTEGGYDYYYIIHISDGKYLTHNTSKTTTENRLRVHLETVSNETSLTDDHLFRFNATSVTAATAIIPKQDSSNRSLNPANGNKNDYKGTDSSTATVGGGAKNMGGLIGLYAATGNGTEGSRWYLRDASITRPTISYSGTDGILITNNLASATVYYTTDGSDPTESGTRENFTETSKTLDSFTDGTAIKAVTYSGSEYSNVTTFIPYVHVSSSHPYLLQNVENTNFYMTVGNVSGTNTTVNTSSLPQAGMSWHFEDAGVTDGVQYYYIYNTSAAGYLQRNGDNLYIVTTKTDTDAFKFSITPYYNGETLSGYNIYSKAASKYVYKNNGNGANNAVLLNASNNADYFRWNIIAVSDKNFTSLVTASDDNNATYYTLTSKAADTYLMVPSSTSTGYVTTSTGTADNQKWYFQSAGSDGWASYYYIMNAITGEALYFAPQTPGTGNLSNALQMAPLSNKTSETEYRYQFAIAPTTTIESECYIVPRLLANYAKNSYAAVWRENTGALQTRYNRADAKIKWQISQAATFVVPPVIDYVPATDKVTITCTTPGDVIIYYTTDGSDPTTSSTAYTDGGFTLGTANTVKAIAVKGEGTSSITSRSFINGLYYIKHYNNNYCMYPSTSSGTNGNYVRTTTSRDIDAVWEIRQQNGYYTIKHYNDNKYMWTEDATVMTNTVHLATTADSNDDKLLYEFSPVASGVYTISPKNADNADGKNFLDTTQGDNGTHTIGLYHEGNGIRWQFVNVPSQPVMSVEDISVTITNELGDIVYTTDGTDPATSGTAITVSDSHSVTVTLNYGPEFIVRAVSRYTDNSSESHVSEEVTTTVQVDVQSPVFTMSGNSVTISSPQPHAAEKITIRYNYGETSTNPAEPTATSGTVYDNSSIGPLEDGRAYTFKAIAYTTENGTDYLSSVRTFTVNLKGAEEITTLAGITDQAGNYYFASGFSATDSPSDGIGASADKPFKGKIDGKFVEISLGSNPLFKYVEDATIKNVIVSSASISTNGDAGAIANVAAGNTRIYNCGVNGGSVSGSGNVGGIVGKIEDFARVINCYSFANITGGSVRAGIVGYNSCASKSNDLRTMVMNCIFYGDISTGGTIYPVYGGQTIDNLQNNNGLNNYNYYRYESDFSRNKLIDNNNYNCALAVEENYLTRFEFYRQLLNSNRKLAAWYVTGNVLSEDEVTALMGKWVMNKCDKDPSNTETRYNYPILKSHGKYPSIINYDAEHATAQTERNKGGLLGDLIVNISVGSNTAAAIKSDCSQITLKRTDKDFDNYNLNYNKVQLPYFNDVGTGNYTGNKVVTGWKITSMTGGTQGSFTASDSWGGYNFADRSTYAKDIYSSDNIRVFSQGAYFDVPDDVTAINIEPYWGTAAYVSDPNLDKVYDGSYTESTAADVTGEQYQDGQSYDINGSSQVVYNSISSAVGQLSGSTVYDNAVVLVGNVHQREVPSSGTTPFTIMSADLDNDNEPDYSLIYTHSGRDNGAVSSIRFDFLNVPGMAMVQKPNGSTALRNVNIFKPKGWFEVTNTCLIHFVQFEYDNGGKSTAPLILLGGAYDQFVSTQKSSLNDKHTSYIHVGSNAWFNQFANGTHGDGSNFTPHIPISVTGGDYGNFYLSGIYNPNASVTADDAECYISGGRFQELAGAGQEQIDGKVTWLIDRADITEFYGGGINEEKPITGNITVTIKNSNVTRYCGGPKFGKDDEKKVMVTTEATNCDFVNFYGAGYGGISYNRVKTTDSQSINWTNASNAYTDNRGKYLDKITDSGNKSVDAKGIATDFDNEYFVGSNGNVWGRIYVKFASLSLAEVNEVSSTLKNCRITENFFGGGNRGKVHGNIASTLEDCHVTGSVFGAGFSADVPKIAVRDGGFTTNPSFNSNAGVFDLGVKSGTHDYEWTEGTLTDDTSAITTDYKIHTNKDLGALGQVEGDAEVTLQTTSGNETTVGASVYGGGDQSTVGGNAIVTLKGNTTVNGDVFGGGNNGIVSGSTTVNIEE